MSLRFTSPKCNCWHSCIIQRVRQVLQSLARLLGLWQWILLLVLWFAVDLQKHWATGVTFQICTVPAPWGLVTLLKLIEDLQENGLKWVRSDQTLFIFCFFQLMKASLQHLFLLFQPSSCHCQSLHLSELFRLFTLFGCNPSHLSDIEMGKGTTPLNSSLCLLSDRITVQQQSCKWLFWQCKRLTAAGTKENRSALQSHAMSVFWFLISSCLRCWMPLTLYMPKRYKGKTQISKFSVRKEMSDIGKTSLGELQWHFITKYLRCGMMTLFTREEKCVGLREGGGKGGLCKLIFSTTHRQSPGLGSPSICFSLLPKKKATHLKNDLSWKEPQKVTQSKLNSVAPGPCWVLTAPMVGNPSNSHAPATAFDHCHSNNFFSIVRLQTTLINETFKRVYSCSCTLS